MENNASFQVRVVVDYQAPHSNPIRASSGDMVHIDWSKKTDIPGWAWCIGRSGQSGWAPITYLNLEGSSGILLHDYDSVELTIHIGEIYAVHATESGFYWVMDESGRQGWIPASCVEVLIPG